jgi:hypothetical protein
LVDIWLWRSSWGRPPDVSRHLLDEYPFATPIYDRLAKPGAAPDFLTARAAGNLNADVGAHFSASRLAARGFGSTTFRPKAMQQVSAVGKRQGPTWSVVLRRPLQVEDGLQLRPADRYSAAFAIWDGKLKDRDGQKLISIWQDLKLE